ncbi:MAG TPA: ATP-binding protein [Chloroflexia bacterium]|nr:ATP-binding protein [Chloroflexia bacterium]
MQVRRLVRILAPLPAFRRGMDRLIAGAAAEETPWLARLRRYGLTVLALAATTAGFWPLKESAGLLNIGLVYLIVVAGAATFGGRGPGLLAAGLGFALFDFFLIPPYLEFAIGDLHNILALFVFLGFSVLISTLITRAREAAAQAERRATDLHRLYALSQTVLQTTGRDAILAALVAQVVDMVEAEAGWIWVPAADGPLKLAAQAPAQARAPLPSERELAQHAYIRAALLGLGDGVPGERLRPRTLCAPLRTAEQGWGVLGVTAGGRRRPFTRAEQTVLVTLAEQVALALDRLALREEAERAEVLERTDELKSALLHTVSHDLRTPLASIKATATSLLDPAITWDSATQRLFIQAIDTECDRLTHLVSDLLEMSRIEGGALQLTRDWYAIGEVIETVRERLAGRLADHPLAVDAPADLPLVPLDFVKIDAVLTNLLENAIKYTPPGTPILVRAVAWAGVLAVTVADQGPGVAPQHLAHLFDKFYRAGGRSSPQGSGLGLAIVKGMVEAHGGTISARSSAGQGLTITFTLPLTLAAPAPAGAGAGRAAPEEDTDGR